MDKEIGHKPYSGPYVFINSTTDKLTRSRDENFAISSHVSKNHRKWLKDERLKRLNASAGKALAQRVILPAAPPTQTVGPLPHGTLYHPEASTAADTDSHSRLRGRPSPPLTDDGSNEVSATQMVRYSRGALGSQHVYSFENSQEIDDQERLTAWKLYLWLTGQPSLIKWKGCYDPFQTAAVPLTPRDHEIIRQALLFPVFAAWPSKATAVFRAPIADTANSHIKLQQAMTSEAHIHAILASGYHMAAGSLGPNSEVFRGRGLAHKTRAVALLRQNLLTSGLSEGAASLIRLLISLDFEAADLTASLIHLRGLWAMSSSVPGTLLDIQELLIVSDVWISLSLLKKPEISPSRYDPGGRALQTFDSALRLLDGGTNEVCFYEPETESRSETALDNETFRLLDAAHEVVNTKATMDKIQGGALQQEVVWWMHRRATAVSGLLVTGYVDATGSGALPIVADHSHFRKELIAAACLCGILFMNLRFVDSPSNYNFSKTYQSIEPILRQVSHQSGDDMEHDQNEVYLWLLLMCAMGGDVYAARGDIPFSGWPAQEFRRVCARLDIKDKDASAATLRRFQYYSEMDEFITELLSYQGELPNGPIIPWSKWCDILNHYAP